MTFESSVAFVLAMSLFVASPGPGVMACISVAMKRNILNSLAFLVGLIAGDLVYLTFAVFGLTAIANNFGTVFYSIRVLGGIYLIYLAFKMWRSTPQDLQAKMPGKKRNNMLAGFFITISNPKVIVFYCGFLPNFMNLTKLQPADIVIVAFLVSFVIIMVMGTYTIVAYKTGGFLSRRSGRLLNKSAGAVLAATGTYLLVRK